MSTDLEDDAPDCTCIHCTAERAYAAGVSAGFTGLAEDILARAADGEDVVEWLRGMIRPGTLH